MLTCFKNPNHPTHQTIVLENDTLKATFSNFGCTLQSLCYKPLQRETVLSLDHLEDQMEQGFYLNTIVGRVANRIDNGHFTLDGILYTLPINSPPHHLHGGPIGFNRKFFEVRIQDETLVLKHTSPNQDQGYPGTLEIEARYHLEESSLIIEFITQSDQKTLADLTQHTYFNLNENKSIPIGNHRLHLNSDSFRALNASGCTDLDIIPFDETDFDFSQSTLIQTALNSKHPQIIMAKGIDHYFPKKDLMNPWFSTLSIEGLSLQVETDLPGAHLYSGNYLSSSASLQAPFLRENGGICFETHHHPNSINYDIHLAPILLPHIQRHVRTVYTFIGENI